MSVTGESRLLIDGKLVNATGNRTYPNVNPATEEVIGQVADATREDMDRAIGAARRAFDTTDWSTNLAKRAKCLRQLHAALDEAQGGVARRRSWPRSARRSCSPTPSSRTRCIAGHAVGHRVRREVHLGARARRARVLRLRRAGALVRREPIGVAGLITPWNFPFMLNLSKVVPALMAGCTAVLKAAPDTPWSATWIGKLIAEETELPPGVLNIVTARDPAEVGDQLTGDPRVDVDLVHRLDRDRQAHHAPLRGRAEARLPRARRQVRADLPRRRRPAEARAGRAARASACTAGRAARSPRACCCRARATRSASRR